MQILRILTHPERVESSILPTCCIRRSNLGMLNFNTVSAPIQPHQINCACTFEFGIGFQRLVTITSSSLLAVIWYLESSSGKSMNANRHEHMLVGDWVWGIQHWQMSLSLVLAPSLYRCTWQSYQVYSWIFHWQVWPKSLPNEEPLPPLKPARTTAALSLI